jgi:hypothetical protein
VGVFLTTQGNAELNRLNHLERTPLEAGMCFQRIGNNSMLKYPEALHTCKTGVPRQLVQRDCKVLKHKLNAENSEPLKEFVLGISAQ